ncbi:MAG: UDP-3-O-acyl-N-acetylglucosamine deacetylase [Deltaproteobacteria bacterium]|nr:UDP-3-O-acyl-N-acetylglucosamine deacetylase [Deltaproteobacteria bacterium]
MDLLQRTVDRKISVSGIGLHSGKQVNMTIMPAPADAGITFVRSDLENHPEIKANIENVHSTELATTLSANGCRISTIEHLMAAFFGLGVNNAVVEVDSPEVPIMDGSADPFVNLLKQAGIRVLDEINKVVVVTEPICVTDGDKVIRLEPSDGFKISCTIDFEHPLLSNQSFCMDFSDEAFMNEIGPARTFGFLKDVTMLQANGLAKGASLDNAIAIDEDCVLNPDGLRYENEFVRHKILDCIGDLSLLGYPVIGHFIAHKSGHALHHRLVTQLMAQPSAWRLAEATEFADISSPDWNFSPLSALHAAA